MEIEFQGQYKKQQYFRGVYRAQKPSTLTMALRIGLFVVFIAIIIVLFLQDVRDGGLETYQIARLPQHLITLLTILYVVFQPFIKSYQNASRLWRDPITRLPISGRVSSQGVSYGAYTQPWNTFIKKDVQSDLVVLLTADRVMSILPRSFFSTSQDWEQFIQLVERNVKEPK